MARIQQQTIPIELPGTAGHHRARLSPVLRRRIQPRGPAAFTSGEAAGNFSKFLMKSWASSFAFVS